jgi:hypothetical protein
MTSCDAGYSGCESGIDDGGNFNAGRAVGGTPSTDGRVLHCEIVARTLAKRSIDYQAAYNGIPIKTNAV